MLRSECFSGVTRHPPAYSCSDCMLNRRVREVVDTARRSSSFNLRNVRRLTKIELLRMELKIYKPNTEKAKLIKY
jgi:hypothetical protein